MAIYHLTAKTGTRASGHSAEAKADYIQREHRYQRDIDDVLHRESGHMPAWATESRAYWIAADTYERANGRLFKEIEFALPVELTADQQRELTHRFAQQLTATEQLPYTLALHVGKGTNPHCHLLISERVNDGIERTPSQWFRRYNRQEPAQGGSRKTESLKPQQWLEQTRQKWMELANHALERAGVESRIDHRTLEAQGIERIPQLHLGPAVAMMEHRGLRTDRGDQARAIDHSNLQLSHLETERQSLELQLNAGEARDQFRAVWQQHQAEQAHQRQVHELAEQAAAEFRRQLDAQREAEQAREREPAKRLTPERGRERELKRELEHELKRELEHELKRELKHELEHVPKRERSGPELDF